MQSGSQSVSLRKFPYPYRASLAICSDIDGCDKQTFLRVHRFLNSTDQGLGLPVADSFFPVSRGAPGQMAYFLPDGVTNSPAADFIKTAIKDGLIDSIHSWGEFNDDPPDPAFLRPTAERLLNDFLDEGLEITVWINHGSSNNRQNLWARLGPTYEGSDRNSPFYTADLCRRLGVKYYWWSELVSWPLSTQPNGFSPRHKARLGFNSMKNLIKLSSGRKDRVRKDDELTELGHVVNMGDGISLIGFTRFNRNPKGLWSLPTRRTLRHALCNNVLEELINDHGYLILYMHLGLPCDQCETLFTDVDLSCLYKLADKYNNGLIWVATTSSILTYWMVSKYLDWRVSLENNKIFITIESINDPITGRRYPTEKELAGISFYTEKPDETVILMKNKVLPSRVNEPDYTNQYSIGFPAPAPPKLDLLRN
jgi:hypothetical protein